MSRQDQLNLDISENLNYSSLGAIPPNPSDQNNLIKQFNTMQFKDVIPTHLN